MTKAEREAVAISNHLERRGLEIVPLSAYGNGEHYVRIPIPLASRNRRKSATLFVRRVQPVAQPAAAAPAPCPCHWCGSLAGTTTDSEVGDGWPRCVSCGGC